MERTDLPDASTTDLTLTNTNSPALQQGLMGLGGLALMAPSGAFIRNAARADLYRFYDAADFECTDTDCQGLATAIADGARIRYSFEHSAEPGEPLRLVD